jgi:hypothetical protein
MGCSDVQVIHYSEEMPELQLQTSPGTDSTRKKISSKDIAITFAERGSINDTGSGSGRGLDAYDQ